ncbi:MAG: response regulator [Candidatus Competibacterales bacterium]
MTAPLTVLVVDDHPVVRSGCRLLLQQLPLVTVHEAVDGESAYRSFTQHRPDMVVLDISLPDIGGLEVLRRIKSRDACAKVLIFTMRDDPVLGARLLQEGAMGYVTKSCAPGLLVEAVKRVAEGKPFISHDIAEAIALLNLNPRPDPLAALSPRDLELLRLIGGGVGLKDIAERLHLSYKTVANNVSLLKHKLKVSSTSDLVRIAINHGLCSF